MTSQTNNDEINSSGCSLHSVEHVHVPIASCDEGDYLASKCILYALTTTIETTPAFQQAFTTAMDGSPLRRLPAELRLDIYERCLLLENGLTLDFSGRNITCRYEARARRKQILAITVTCKVIRAESAHLIFTINVVRCRTSSTLDALESLHAWFHRPASGPTKLIRHLETDLAECTPVSYDFGPDVLAEQLARALLCYPEKLRRSGVQHRIRFCVAWASQLRVSNLCRRKLGRIEVVMNVSQTNDEAREALTAAVAAQMEGVDEHLQRLRSGWAVPSVFTSGWHLRGDLERAYTGILEMMKPFEGVAFTTEA